MGPLSHIPLWVSAVVFCICTNKTLILYLSWTLKSRWIITIPSHFDSSQSYWFQGASACRGFKQGFGSWPVTEVGSRWWEHWILATRPVVSDKALALWLCRERIPTKMESSETTKVLIKRRKEYVWINAREGSETDPRPHGSFNHFYGAFIPGFL